LFHSYLKPEITLDLPTQKRLIRKLLAIIKNLKSPIERQNWLRNLSRCSGVSEDVLIEEMNMLKIKKTAQVESFVENVFNNDRKERLELIAEKLILLSLYKEEFLSLLKSHLDYLPKTFQEMIQNPSKIPDYLKLKASYDLSSKNDSFLKEEFEELLVNLKLEFLKGKQKELKENIQLIQAQNDEIALEEALQKFHLITVEIHQTKQKTLKKI